MSAGEPRLQARLETPHLVSRRDVRQQCRCSFLLQLSTRPVMHDRHRGSAAVPALLSCVFSGITASSQSPLLMPPTRRHGFLSFTSFDAAACTSAGLLYIASIACSLACSLGHRSVIHHRGVIRVGVRPGGGILKGARLNRVYLASSSRYDSSGPTVSVWPGRDPGDFAVPWRRRLQSPHISCGADT